MKGFISTGSFLEEFRKCFTSDEISRWRELYCFGNIAIATIPAMSYFDGSSA